MTQKNKNYEFLHEVESTIIKYDMLQEKDAVLVGVSGGPDSVALLLSLIELRNTFSIKIGIAHLNHLLRGDASENDAGFVKDLAAQLNLPVYITSKDVEKYKNNNGLSLEEAGRQVRYNFLYQTAETEKYNKIALGHHSDDNAELVLMQLLRGSGPLGMAGIPAVRENIIRPLIHTSKSDILDYLKNIEQAFVFDKSNEDTVFLRNRVRYELIPSLKKNYNPNIIDTINRMSSIVRNDEEWIDSILAPVFERLVEHREKDSLVIDARLFSPLHIAEKRRLIRMAIKAVKGDLRQITLIHVDSVIALLEKGPENKSLDLPGRIRTMYANGQLEIKKEKQNLRELEPTFCETFIHPFEYRISENEVNDTRIFIEEIGIYLKFSQTNMEFFSDLSYPEKHVAYMDMDALKFPLFIRNTNKGDSFSPFGMTGTQKLKKYFINNKISKSERARVPVLVSDGKIVWVVGHRIDNSVKLSSETKTVLKVEMMFS